MASIYDFTLTDKAGNAVSLRQYEGKVLLVINSATGCGFTPQYEALEDMYRRLRDRGLEILDIPCNQFGGQAPGSDAEITEFCTLRFGTDFPQFRKAEVNGPGELPLYTWLKSQRGFGGFDADNQLTPVLEGMFDKAIPDWRTTSDIKWNFTKFLIGRDGQVVARFEPTRDVKAVEAEVVALL